MASSYKGGPNATRQRYAKGQSYRQRTSTPNMAVIFVSKVGNPRSFISNMALTFSRYGLNSVSSRVAPLNSRHTKAVYKNYNLDNPKNDSMFAKVSRQQYAEIELKDGDVPETRSCRISTQETSAYIESDEEDGSDFYIDLGYRNFKNEAQNALYNLRSNATLEGLQECLAGISLPPRMDLVEFTMALIYKETLRQNRGMVVRTSKVNLTNRLNSDGISELCMMHSRSRRLECAAADRVCVNMVPPANAVKADQNIRRAYTAFQEVNQPDMPDIWRVLIIWKLTRMQKEAILNQTAYVAASVIVPTMLHTDIDLLCFPEGCMAFRRRAGMFLQGILQWTAECICPSIPISANITTAYPKLIKAHRIYQEENKTDSSAIESLLITHAMMMTVEGIFPKLRRNYTIFEDDNQNDPLVVDGFNTRAKTKNVATCKFLVEVSFVVFTFRLDTAFHEIRYRFIAAKSGTGMVFQRRLLDIRLKDGTLVCRRYQTLCIDTSASRQNYKGDIPQEHPAQSKLLSVSPHSETSEIKLSYQVVHEICPEELLACPMPLTELLNLLNKEERQNAHCKDESKTEMARERMPTPNYRKVGAKRRDETYLNWPSFNEYPQSEYHIFCQLKKGTAWKDLHELLVPVQSLPHSFDGYAYVLESFTWYGTNANQQNRCAYFRRLISFREYQGQLSAIRLAQKWYFLDKDDQQIKCFKCKSAIADQHVAESPLSMSAVPTCSCMQQSSINSQVSPPYVVGTEASSPRKENTIPTQNLKANKRRDETYLNWPSFNEYPQSEYHIFCQLKKGTAWKDLHELLVPVQSLPHSFDGYAYVLESFTWYGTNANQQNRCAYFRRLISFREYQGQLSAIRLAQKWYFLDKDDQQIKCFKCKSAIADQHVAESPLSMSAVPTCSCMQQSSINSQVSPPYVVGTEASSPRKENTIPTQNLKANKIPPTTAYQRTNRTELRNTATNHRATEAQSEPQGNILSRYALASDDLPVAQPVKSNQIQMENFHHRTSLQAVIDEKECHDFDSRGSSESGGLPYADPCDQDINSFIDLQCSVSAKAKKRVYQTMQADCLMDRKCAAKMNLEKDQLEENNCKLRWRNNCIQCCRERRQIVFLPCGHLLFCDNCYTDVLKCPVCQKGTHAMLTIQRNSF